MNKIDDVKIMITVDLPNREVDSESLASYIADALQSYGGGLHPNDPLFDSLSVKAVRVGNRVFLVESPKQFQSGG